MIGHGDFIGFKISLVSSLVPFFQIGHRRVWDRWDVGFVVTYGFFFFFVS